MAVHQTIFGVGMICQEVVITSFNANDKPLCSNNTFWRTQSCDIIEVDGVTRAVGQRCIGQAQSCYYPWYTTLNHWYEVRFNMY